MLKKKRKKKKRKKKVRPTFVYNFNYVVYRAAEAQKLKLRFKTLPQETNS
jgi:hypothetical protein